MKKNKKVKFKGALSFYLQLPCFMGVVLLAADIALFVYTDINTALTAFALTVLYFVVALISYEAAKRRLVIEIIDFATQYGTVQKRLLYEFETAYALVDSDGRLVWYNRKFIEATGCPKRTSEPIGNIFPYITNDILSNPEAGEIEYAFGDRYFRAVLDRVYFDSILTGSEMIETGPESDYLTAVQIFDITELEELTREKEDQRLVVCQAYIDNYEEAIESVEEVSRSLLIALIDRKVSAYFSKADALIRKIERDKYFIVFRHKYLQELMDDKFSVLEEVKGVKVGNNMPVTLSIAVGDSRENGDSYAKKSENSHIAMDLALGRGGDQAVVRENEAVTYFGGNEQTNKKNTRVKARVKAQALRGLFEDSNHIMVMGHKLADMDSFGASLGIFCAARAMGKRASIVIGTVAGTLRPMKECFVPENGYPEDMFLTPEQAAEMCKANTVVVVVDTNRPVQTECPELIKKSRMIAVFDHHRQSTDIIESPRLSYVEPYASSACEMVVEVLQYFDKNFKLTSAEADALLAGIIIDTNNFMSKAGVRTFEAAASLRRSGAEVTRVRKMLRNDMDDYKARAEIIRKAELFKGVFAFSVCDSDNLENPTVVGAQASNELLNITGIKAAFVLTEFNDKIYVSARSIDEINVHIIMEKIGGGGHLNMAGAQLSNCDINQAALRIKDIINEMIDEGDIVI